MTTRNDALKNAADLLRRAGVRSYGSTPKDLEHAGNLTAQAQAWLDLARQLGDEAQVQRNLAVFGPPQPAFGGPVVCQNTIQDERLGGGGYSDEPVEVPVTFNTNPLGE